MTYRNAEFLSGTNQTLQRRCRIDRLDSSRASHGPIARFSVIGLFVCFMLFTTVAAWGEPNAPPSKAPEPRKKLIVWGGLDHYNPATVSANIRKFEELPFDGMVLQGFQVNKGSKGGDMFDWRCFGQEKFDRKDLTEIIETLKGIKFQRFTDNFLRFNIMPGVDWFDDFDAVLHNARLWAEITKETGMKGWALDFEDYSGIQDTMFKYKKKKYSNRKTFDEYVRQVRLRGRQFMEAAQQGDPEIAIFMTLGHSYANMFLLSSEYLPQADDYSLLPAFINGMLDAAGPKVRIIDGHEQAYSYLTAEDFLRGYHNSQQESLSLVPTELWGKYREKVDVAMAVWVNWVFGFGPYPGNYPAEYVAPDDRMRLFEQTIYYALKTADEYAWVYNEYMCYWEPGARWATPDGAMDAIRSAKKKIQNNEPLGFDMADRVAAAKAVFQEASPNPSVEAALPSGIAMVVTLPTPSSPFSSFESALSRISKGKAAPVINGVLDDAIWKDIPPLHPFAPKKTDSKTATTAMAAYDDEHLYFAFTCAEPETGKLSSMGDKKDDNAIWKGDCVDVFVMAPEKPSWHFIINPKNLQWEGLGYIADWNANWQSGAGINAKDWVAEIAIPWSAIGGQPAAKSIRTFLCRRRAASNEVHAVVQSLSLAEAESAK